MELYRYNSKKRKDRKFNTTGREKNPNGLKFYGKTLDYAKKYEVIYDEEGYSLYNCELEVVEVSDLNLFDMSNEFSKLKTYSDYINNEIGAQLKDYTYFLNNAKKASERKMWEKQIDELKNRESELVAFLIKNEFQALSDNELQNTLVCELKGLGFEGYQTKNEVCVF